MIRHALSLSLIATMLTCTVVDVESAHAQTPASPIEAPPADPLDITDLKIEMAESGLAVSPSLAKIADLSNALEAYLNRNCFGDLLKTLSYEGPPTDPKCIARMERLFEIYPENPVATCLRDGIKAASCRDAYQKQRFEEFKDSSSSKNLLDAALKVGLSANDQKKVRALQDTLSNVNKDYQSAKSAEDKQKHLDDALRLYDQLLSITCKLSTISLEESISEKVKRYEDPSVREARERLLKIPPNLREDYKKKMLEDAELELARHKNYRYEQATILEKIQAIQNPEREDRISAKGAIRKKVVLPECFEAVERAQAIIAEFPSPQCHRVGWNSPQCIEGIQGWYDYRKRVQAAAKAREMKNATPTPQQVISSF